MTFSTLILSSLILAGTPLAGAAQAGAPQAGGHRRAVEGTSYPEAAAAGEAALAMDAKDDPGLAMYKSGYELVLAEKWEEARKKLLEMIKNYPSSEYADDAQYWAAYSLMHIDRKKAEEEYKAFIKKYAHSNYYDDAVSDLNSLTTTITV